MPKLDVSELVEKRHLRDDLPDFGPGDTIKVQVKVSEGGRERLQSYQGVVIRRRGGGTRETFTARKISFGVGVERTFPLHSPSIASIEVITRGDVRRAKLYYLRGRVGKKARIKEKRHFDVPAKASAADMPPEDQPAPVESDTPPEQTPQPDKSDPPPNTPDTAQAQPDDAPGEQAD